jgi:phenylpyruvate tautomerase PptA (4-oxalocrotonate tautomerase family)
MPIGYLDVPASADLSTKKKLVKAMYEAMHEVYPFPDDTRIFLREWPLDSVSQNGLLGSEPARPVFIVHIPQGGDVDAKRNMLKKINAAVADAYHLPDFATFIHEHSLETVVINGGILADDQQRVEDQRNVYG